MNDKKLVDKLRYQIAENITKILLKKYESYEDLHTKLGSKDGEKGICKLA